MELEVSLQFSQKPINGPYSEPAKSSSPHRYSDLATNWTTGARFLAGAGIFFSSPQRPDRLSEPLSLLSNWYRGFFPWKREIGYSIWCRDWIYVTLDLHSPIRLPDVVLMHFLLLKNNPKLRPGTKAAVSFIFSGTVEKHLEKKPLHSPVSVNISFSKDRSTYDTPIRSCVLAREVILFGTSQNNESGVCPRNYVIITWLQIHICPATSQNSSLNVK